MTEREPLHIRFELDGRPVTLAVIEGEDVIADQPYDQETIETIGGVVYDSVTLQRRINT